MAKIKANEQAWDDRQLGADASHAKALSDSETAALDDSLGLQMISIRLPRQLIEQYKLIGHFHGVGYQPLMRDVLARFVPGALKEIFDAETQKAATQAETLTNPALHKAA